ncbi:hypothetical protein BJY01DRAFT_16129 [Aspergillus pseudoustus]|uniref:Uncharacterized protein n=1 Tax=Aspergillus pseudoustus TaxID=1810923 RepID=A0ABR4JLS3_9EURO
MKRPGSRQQIPLRATEALKEFLDTAQKLSVLQKLGDSDKKQVADAISILKTLQTTSKRRKYRFFLHNILKRYGPHMVLLCAVALGQVATANMREAERAKLEDLIGSQPELANSAIRRLAVNCKIPDSIDNLSDNSLETPETHLQTRTQSVDTCFTTTLEAPSQPRSTVQEQEVIGHAVLERLPRVFNEYLCKAIRKVTDQNSGIPLMKAAVTMAFPRSGLVDCLMSLDVCEQEVEQLALLLFNTKVKWMEQVLHVVVNGGITLIMPNSEVTLKGVLDEAIITVFGHDIYEAISTSRVRTTEVEQEMPVTECVSMILTKTGAFINLSLGLEGAVRIQNELYT